MIGTKSLVTKICTVALLLLSSADISQAQVKTNSVLPQLRNPVDRPPGMGLRLQQRTVNQFKAAMGKFLPHYLTYDLGINKLKEDYEFAFLFGLIKYKIEFNNIHYPEPELDLSKTKIQFTDMFHRPMLKVKFPGIKLWQIYSHTVANTWILPKETDVVFQLKDLELDFNTEFEVTSKGTLKPILWATELNWGSSKFYHENIILAALMD